MALGGIAALYRARLGDDVEYFAGLWKTGVSGNFLSQLCWKAWLPKSQMENPDTFTVLGEQSPIGGQAEPSRRRPLYCAPTWSWAAVSSAIRFDTHRGEVEPLTVVRKIDVRLQGADRMGPFTARPCTSRDRSRRRRSNGRRVYLVSYGTCIPTTTPASAWI